MIKVRFNRTDFIIGVFLLSVFILIYLFIIPNYCRGTSNGVVALSQPFFIYVISILMILMSLIFIFSSLFILGKSNTQEKTQKVSDDKMDTVDILRVIGTALISIFYIYIIDYLGFYIGSAFIMFVFMIYFGYRKLKFIIFSIFTILFFIYLVLNEALRVFLPSGILF